jgi:lysophospholipase L1-like esterase
VELYKSRLPDELGKAMRKLLLSLGAAALSIISVTAQTSSLPNVASSAQPAQPSATPPSTTTPDNARYLAAPKLMAGCQARLDAFNDKPCNIIFIGDSITEGWVSAGKAIWDKMYAPRHALDFGISGDQTQNVLWRLSNMEVSSLKPKVAVILIGTNNTANSPHEIADGVHAVIANTQAAFPGVKVILVSIMPNERAHDKMAAANSIIKNFADDSTVYYLDLVPLMPEVQTTAADGTSDTNWKGLSKDHLHPDASGYQIWADAMEPLLSKLLAGG